MGPTLGEALPEEIIRVQKLIDIHIQRHGCSFGTTVMQNDIKTARTAIMEEDITTMLVMYETLKEYKA